MAVREIKNLDQLMDGGVTAIFNAELKKVWDNIFDLRTEPNKKRKLTLTFEFMPTTNRDAAVMKYYVKPTLVQPSAVQQTVFMHQRDDGTVVVTEQTSEIPGQIDLDGNEAPEPMVIEFSKSI